MTERDVTLLVLGLATGLMAWLLKELWSEHKKLRDKMANLEKQLPSEFATKEDVTETRMLAEKAEGRMEVRIARVEIELCKRVDACTASVQELGVKITEHFVQLLEKLNGKADKK